MRILLALLSLFLLMNQSKAQQGTMFTHYMYNPLIINPAYAGSRDALTIVGIHRSQWTGFDGAPTTQAFSMHSPIRHKNFGGGMSFFNDKVGPVKTASLNLDLAYRLRVDSKSFLSLGLKGGLDLIQGNLSQLVLENQSDDLFAVDGLNKYIPNFGFGAYYKSEKYYLGLGIPNLVEYSILKNNSIGQFEGVYQQHFYLLAGFVHQLSSDWLFKPNGYIKYTEGGPVQLDLTANLRYSEKIEFGMMFRSGDAAGALFGIQLNDQFYCGYSFDWSYRNQTFLHNLGSHELMLRYDFEYNVSTRRVISPRYF